jgi:MoaE-MoaD fusion protein
VTSVRVLFFGATAEIVGSREKLLTLHEPLTSRDILAMVKKDHPGLNTRKLLLSINQEFASGDETVKHGDELAVFTPVSGG